MNKQTLQLIQMILDPRITARLLWVLAKLRAKGVRRIPDNVYKDLKSCGVRGNALTFLRQWMDGEMFTRHNGQWVLNSFLPPFPGRGYNRMFDNLLSGRHLSPVSVFLAITSQCPCQCSHCSAQRNIASELTTEQWVDTLRQLQSLGTSIIGFTGGEPLQREDLSSLVAESRQLGMESILFTSGAGISAERFHDLKKAGLWACCISLDFDTPKEHDEMRGRAGTFDDAIEAIRLSKQSGLYTLVSSVATRTFIEDQMFTRVYSLCKKMGVHEYRIVEPMPCGALSDADEKKMLLTSEHTQILRDFHVQTNRKQQHPKVCAFNQIESPEIFGCGAGTQHFYIQPDGTVCPCDFTPLGFGNVKTDPLPEIWTRMNIAMGDNPRRHCFIQKHHNLINRHTDKGFPLPAEVSEAICAATDPESLPDYFAMLTSQPQEK